MPIDAQWILWIGAAGGFVAAFYSRLRGVVDYVSSYVLVQIRVEGEAARAVAYHLWRSATPSRFGERRYAGMVQFIRPLDRFGAVAYETTAHSARVFWLGWRPVLVRKSVPASTEAQVPESTTLTFLRWCWGKDDLVVAAVRAYNTRFEAGVDADLHRRFRVVDVGGSIGAADGGRSPQSAPVAYNGAETTDRVVGYDRDELGQEPPGKPFAGYAPSPATDRARERSARWAASKQLHRDRGVPWRYGMLLHGPPGTGKSSFVRELARDLDLPVFRFNLSEMSNRDFRSEWSSAQSNAPCVVAIEDIDAVFDGRENLTAIGGNSDRKSPTGLTFDCLLNIVGGIDPADGVLLVVTTNHPDKVDPALKRSGRLDLHVEFGPLDREGRELIAARILAGYDALVEEAVRDGDGEAGADFQERCQSMFLKAYWSKS